MLRRSTALLFDRSSPSHSFALFSIAHAYEQLPEPARAAGLGAVLRRSKQLAYSERKIILESLALGYGVPPTLDRAAELAALLPNIQALNSEEQIRPLTAVAQAYGRLASPTQAQHGLQTVYDLATRSLDDEKQPPVLSAIAEAYARQHQWQRAHDVIRLIQSPGEQARPLYVLLREWHGRGRHQASKR